jgi:hypothetical protein
MELTPGIERPDSSFSTASVDVRYGAHCKAEDGLPAEADPHDQMQLAETSSFLFPSDDNDPDTRPRSRRRRG